eukprot:jgi/Pico_ML_1/51983/g2766.t1
MVEERPTETDAGGEDDVVPPPTEVPPEEAFLDVQECTTLHEEGLDPLGDGVDANKVAGNGFGLVWEEEEAHVMVDSRAANGVMDRQQGYGLPSSYMLEPFRETEALQYFLRFFPYELLLDQTSEITKRGRSKYNRPGTMKYMIKHPSDTTYLLEKKIPTDDTRKMYRSKYNIAD